MISGTTALIAHVGYPTYTFKSSLIYNPWFEKNGVDAVVVPMGIKAEDYPVFLRSVSH
jgi:shikimate dehydrogenase